MARQEKKIPNYGTITTNGNEYYRTRIMDTDGARVALYAKTPEELYEKAENAKKQIREMKQRNNDPTVEEYCEKWLQMQSVRIRETTLIDYTSKVKKYIVEPLGDKLMRDVTADDVKMALIPVSQKSRGVFRCVHMLYNSIFNSAVYSHLLKESPCEHISGRGGKPQKERQALTDDQVTALLAAIKGLPPYVFVMIGLYAGMRREEILALKWDCVFLNTDAPYISVKRAWHTEHNRPVITTELKSNAARRDIPIPPKLAECLKEAKKTSKSDYVVPNSEGGPVTYTQFQRIWKYITTRTVQERSYYRYVDGKRTLHTVTPVLGEAAAHNSNVVYTLDFHVTPHQLRHTYITNLIYASVDPKTVQYLAGHEHSKITMDIYAKVKYNRPEELSAVVTNAFR